MAAVAVTRAVWEGHFPAEALLGDSVNHTPGRAHRGYDCMKRVASDPARSEPDADRPDEWTPDRGQEGLGRADRWRAVPETASS
jgi:hypothetical protein